MPHPLTQLKQAIRDRLGWQAVGAAVSIAIAVVAFIALAHALKKLDVHLVLEGIWRTDAWRIALAATLVSASYGSLTLYDLLALRAIDRRDIPYRIAALASFTSYPIAHGLGAVLPISTAIRYRVYSIHGLGAGDVARICFLTGLTFWLGNLTALGLSMMYEPAAISLIDHLSEVINRLLAGALLVAIGGYLCWTWNDARRVGHRLWSVKLPAGRIVLLQIAIGVVDLGCAALALYVLIPAGMNVEIPRIIVVFIAATLLGFASHTPGGLGVFDATILIGLDTEDKEPLVAALILFRLFYHLLPFVLALAIFGLREGWHSVQGRNNA
jgi:glycosyltransferase 2 family protein